VALIAIVLNDSSLVERNSHSGGQDVQKLLYAVRHCQPEGQSPEAPLTSDGQAQARVVARFLIGLASADSTRIERIVSSPYARAMQTVTPLAEHLALDVEIDDRLRERTLTMVPIVDWRERLRASFEDLDICLDGGESGRKAMQRAVAALDSIRQHPARTTVVVTHGNLLTLLLKHFDARVGFDQWECLTSPDVFRVVLDGDSARFTRVWRWR
jgi:2,3-bisphosphoglycerate-dependent phosphoglycerate mutase